MKLHELSPVRNICDIPSVRSLRLVRSDCLINVLNTSVEVKPELTHTYVEATDCITDHCLQIRQDG